MAITSLGTLLNGNSKTSATTLVVATSAQLSVGQIGIIAYAQDNNGTTANSNTVTSVTDAAGNFWWKLGERTNGGGASNAGVTVAVFMTVATSQLNSGSNITITNNSARPARAVTGWRFESTEGSVLSIASANKDASAATASGSLLLSLVPVGEYLFLRATAAETPNTNVWTPTASYTPFTDTNAGTTGGADDTNISIRASFRIQTATGDSTDPSFTSACDQTSLFFILKETPLYLVAGSNISTKAGASGVANWSDLVLVGSTLLTTHTAVNGRSIYRYTGTITLRGTAQLTINEFVVELLRTAAATAASSGQISVDSGARLLVSNTTLIISSYDAQYGVEGSTRFRIKKTGTGKIDFENSLVMMNTPSIIIGLDPRIEVQATSISNTQIIRGAVASINGCFVQLFDGDGYNNSQLINVSIELGEPGGFSQVSNITINTDALNAFVNWTNSSVTTRSLNVFGTPTHDWWSNTTSYNTFIDCGLDLASGNVMVEGLPITDEHRKGWSIHYQLVDSAGAVEDALILFSGESNESRTTDVEGKHSEIVLITEKTQLVGATPPGAANSYVSFASPLTISDLATYSRLVKSYRHLEANDTVEVLATVGSVETPLGLGLLLDTGVSEANTATVGAYAGISHTATGFSLSGALTLAQIYDSRKLYWRNNSGVTAPVISGDAADFGNTNIAIAAPANSPAAGSKFTLFRSTGTVDLQTAGIYLNGRVPAVGTVTVADGETDLSDWSFAAGATINLRPGATAAVVTVAASDLVGITAGAGVTIQEPALTTVISGFPTASNANDVAPAPVIGFYSAPNVAGFIAGLNTFDPEYSAGSFTVHLSDYPGVAYVVGDAVGWVRTDYIPVDGENPPASVSVAAAFVEYVDENGNALVGLGTTEGKAKLTYNQPAGRFEVAAGVINFSSVVDKKEDLTSTVVGLEAFDTATVRAIRFVANKYGKEVQLPSPLTAAAAANAATSPILEDFLLTRAGDPTEDPFAHGLASTAPGLSDRPEIRMLSTLFISGSAGGSSGLGPEDIARLERIEQQLIADVSKGRDRYQRLLPGTSTVILDKDVIYDPETGFTLTEHEEPPP